MAWTIQENAVLKESYSQRSAATTLRDNSPEKQLRVNSLHSCTSEIICVLSFPTKTDDHFWLFNLCHDYVEKIPVHSSKLSWTKQTSIAKVCGDLNHLCQNGRVNSHPSHWWLEGFGRFNASVNHQWMVGMMANVGMMASNPHQPSVANGWWNSSLRNQHKCKWLEGKLLAWL